MNLSGQEIYICWCGSTYLNLAENLLFSSLLLALENTAEFCHVDESQELSWAILEDSEVVNIEIHAAPFWVNVLPAWILVLYMYFREDEDKGH